MNPATSAHLFVEFVVGVRPARNGGLKHVQVVVRFINLQHACVNKAHMGPDLCWHRAGLNDTAS